MNKLLNGMKNEANKTVTWNGSPAFKSTKSAVLDLFALGPNARAMDATRLNDMIRDAMYENEELAIRAIFYAADVRGGQGSRDVMRAAIKFLVERYPAQARELIALIPEYTRWDMVYEFVGTPLERDAFAVLKAEVKDAIKNKRNSLVFKWLKSVNTSSEESNKLGRMTAKAFGMNERDYRKMLSQYRAELGVVEVEMSADQWNEIDFSKLPSRAGFLYKEAFKRHTPEKYDSFVHAVVASAMDETAPKVKMNMDVVYPHEIVSKYRQSGSTGGRGWGGGEGMQITKTDMALEAMWKSLPNYMENKPFNCLVMADISGSMFSPLDRKTNTQCIDMSVALAIYMAEHTQGAFRNHYITFTNSPRLVELNDKMTLREKINLVYRTDVGYDTNIDAAFKMILDTAKRNRLSQVDMPDSILLVSDMQFNCGSIPQPNFKTWKQAFEAAGYKLPQIVFWQVTAPENVPVTADELGAALVGGASATSIRFVLTQELITPYEAMLRVITRERYDAVAKPFVRA